jgi:hypothetical protein
MARGRIELPTPRFSVAFWRFGWLRLLGVSRAVKPFPRHSPGCHLRLFPDLVLPHPLPHCRSPRGRDVKQVSAWLGHADAGFTLRTYVHLMDEGIGDAAFMDAGAPRRLRPSRCGRPQPARRLAESSLEELAPAGGLVA